MSYRKGEPADIQGLCRDVLGVDCDGSRDLMRLYAGLTYIEEATGERLWLWDLGDGIGRELVESYRATHEAMTEVQTYDILLTQHRTMAYTVRATSEEEAYELARKLCHSDHFRSRANTDLEECDPWQELDIDVQADGDGVVLGDEDVASYLREVDEATRRFEQAWEGRQGR